MPPESEQTFALASAILQVRPHQLQQVKSQVEQEKGVEVHGVDGRGCLIITLEGAADAPLTDVLYRLRDLDGVLAADLVYQHIEKETAL